MTLIVDQRLLPAADFIASGKIKLLSIDVFDTLLARRTPKPRDVFLHLGRMLLDKKKLGLGQTPDSFAAIRYQSEYTIRNNQQRQFNNREVTLKEIYAHVPAHVTHATIDELIIAEIATEHALCFANADIIQLALLAKQNNVKLSIISNSYFSEQVLRGLIKNKAPELPEFDGFFVSCEHRQGKRDGLMQKMLYMFGVNPAECLHIGDDPVSDRDTADALGISRIDLAANEEFSIRLTEEHPIQWHDRVLHYTQENGDYGYTWLRRQAGHWHKPNIAQQEEPFYRYGAQMVGPVLTGFSCWVNERLQSEKSNRIYGIAREGELLNDLVSILDPKIDCRVLATSRLAAALASFHPDYPDHLEDFLTRRGHWTFGALMEQLGFDSQQAETIGNPNSTLETFLPNEITKTLFISPLAEQLFKRSAERRQRLLLYLTKIGALDNSRLFLTDLGYAATIQRALQRIFTIENIPVMTHGLYLVSAHVSLATQTAGGIVEGFLSQNGNPNDFARAFCRSPEIVELSCMPPHGTTMDYQADGSPIYAEDTTPLRQQGEVAAIQQGMKDFARAFFLLTKSGTSTTSFCTTGWQKQMRSIATRMVIYPSVAETLLMGHWQADSDLGLKSPRAITSMGSYAILTPKLTAAELADLPRRDVPWLYGVATSLSPDLARQVASLMLRK